jgi:hypothetical protein
MNNNYNISLKTTYQDYINNDPSKADLLYKHELLELFKLQENDDFDIINENIQQLYLDIVKINSNIDTFKNLLIKSASRVLSESLEIGFLLLFSYDTMYLIHEFIENLFNKNTFNEKIIQEIINKI